MKKSRLLRNGLMLVLLGVLAYNSVYFKPLDQVKAGKAGFDPVKYAHALWNEKLLTKMDSAVDVKALWPLFSVNKEKAFDDYSNALGIGNVRYFLIKGKAAVTAVEEDRVQVKLEDVDGHGSMRIATEFVFGNAVRDASRTVDMNAFANSMDFNNVSAEINRIIREKVVPPFKSAVRVGDHIAFAGAIELNRAHLNLDQVELIPVKLEIIGQ